MQAATDGVRVAEITFDECLVDDNRLGRRGVVAVGEFTAGAQRDGQRGEIRGTDGDASRVGLFILPGPVAFHGDIAGGIVARKRSAVGRGHAHDAGHGRQAGLEIAIESRGGRGLWPVERGADAERQKLAGAESQVGIQEVGCARAEQTGAHHKQQGKRELRGYQGLPQARGPAAGSDIERPVFQSRRQVGAGRLQGRKQREEQAAGKRNGERVNQQMKIQAGGEPAAGLIARQHPEQGRGAPVFHHQAGHAARQRQDEALDQKLPHQRRAARAHRQPDGDFALPAGGARHHQAGYVGAGDQQDQPHHGDQHAQRFLPFLAQLGDALRGGAQRGAVVEEALAVALIVRGVSHLRQLVNQNGMVSHVARGLRARQAFTRLQTCEEIEPTHPTVGQHVEIGDQRLFHGERHE